VKDESSRSLNSALSRSVASLAAFANRAEVFYNRSRRQYVGLPIPGAVHEIPDRRSGPDETGGMRALSLGGKNQLEPHCLVCTWCHRQYRLGFSRRGMPGPCREGEEPKVVVYVVAIPSSRWTCTTYPLERSAGAPAHKLKTSSALERRGLVPCIEAAPPA
jgi:hypothetical protein